MSGQEVVGLTIEWPMHRKGELSELSAVGMMERGTEWKELSWSFLFMGSQQST